MTQTLIGIKAILANKHFRGHRNSIGCQCQINDYREGNLFMRLEGENEDRFLELNYFYVEIILVNRITGAETFIEIHPRDFQTKSIPVSTDDEMQVEIAANHIKSMDDKYLWFGEWNKQNAKPGTTFWRWEGILE